MYTVELRLYKTPHIDPIHPNLVRLLFEGKVPGKKIQEESDFYMYVWINRLGYLRGFQAVLGDRVTFAYHVPSKRSFGRLARDIINRGITARESSEEKKDIISAIDYISNDTFPALVGFIKKLAHGETIPEAKLTFKEMRIFSEICRNR